MSCTDNKNQLQLKPLTEACTHTFSVLMKHQTTNLRLLKTTWKCINSFDRKSIYRVPLEIN